MWLVPRGTVKQCEMKYSLLLLIIVFTCSCSEKIEVDTIIYGNVYTCDSLFRTVEAIAIKEGKIVKADKKSVIDNAYKAKHIINAEGEYIYPGFIDAHCHFSAYALDGYKCDLVGTTSYQEVLNKLVEYEKSNELGWIYGRGWDQNDWDVKQYPTKEQLDILFPNKPVILKRIDGHAVLCNQLALDKAGINTSTFIKGGIIEKKNGKLTGILIDNATEPVEKLIQPLNNNEAIKYLKRAEQECFSLGLTGVVDCGVKVRIIKQLFELYEDKSLTISNSILLDQEQKTLDAFAEKGFHKKGQIQINGIKLYADGSLGSRGACLLSPYSDMHNHYGMLLSDTGKMIEVAKLAKAHNLQLCTHAIGDSANRAILRLYSNILSENNDLRWRIEHAQVVDSQDYIWFSKYKIIPSVQPTHAISDMPWAVDRIGKKRLPNAYAYKKLLKQNGWLALGTDFPVEQINPLETFYTAVVRKDKNGYPKNGFLVENALSRKEALLGMTAWAAKSVFWESERGSIQEGKNADFVILDKDILTIAEREILNTKVTKTILKGNVAYNKNGAE